ncbi:MAG: DUF4368 domain-containing protein [Ruminococcaceae bacterium]|nr:DUF4368 domain-containing protein [Oscillospiraceae bacterium]
MREKVAIYCRLSEEDKNKQNATDDSGSIQNQKAMLRDYAARMGWELYGIYSDDDYAGSDRNRPEFKRLLADAQAKKFDIILCKTQSRFTRELELVERYIHGLFPIWGIRFVSIVDNADTANKGNKKSRQINGLVNEWYLEDMSDSIKSALDSRRKNGFHIGSFALYGYKKDPDLKGHLIIDEEAAAVVREVFTLFSQGYGKTAIARMLNDRGIPNPTEYKRMQGLRFSLPPSKNSTLWKYFAISDMLVNETYIGNLVQGKYESISYKTSINRPRPKEQWFRVEGTHEPIIDRALWDRVQKMIAERAKPFKVGTIGLFAKKVRCASCGYVMRSSKSGGRHFLQCPNRHYAKGACEGAFISVDRLERMVIAELRRLNAEYLNMDELECKVQFNAELLTQKQEIEAEIATYQGKINQFSKGVRDLYLDKVKGLICEADFIELSKDFTTQKERLEAQVLECQKRIAEIEVKIAVGDNRRELIEKYVKVEHLTREMVEILIDKIMVGKRIPSTRNVPIEIHWNF